MTNEEKSLQWLHDIFLPQSSEKQKFLGKKLLIIDGHARQIAVELQFMWSCYLQDVQLYYLLADCSHITQPLDVGVFSSLKTAYRKAISKHAMMDDKAPIAKQRFIHYYAAAREKAVTKTNIKSGWSATGIWPYHPEKAMFSKFVKDDREEPSHRRPTTPPGPGRFLQTPSVNDIKTPKTHRDWFQLARYLQVYSPSGKTLSKCVRKIGKSLERGQFDMAVVLRQNAAYLRQIEDLRGKRKKRRTVHPNGAFVQLSDLIREEEEATKQKAAKSAAIPVEESLQKASTLAAKLREQAHVIGKPNRPILIE